MRRLLQALVVVTIACVAALWAVPVSSAAGIITSVTPQPVAQGAQLTIIGSGFTGTQVRVDWNDYITFAGFIPEDVAGNINGAITVPSGGDGTFQINVCDAIGDCNAANSATATVVVGPAPPPPAPTVTPTSVTRAPGGVFTITSGSGFDPVSTVTFRWGDFATPLPNPPNVLTDSAGHFQNVHVTIPASATPGQSYQLAVCTAIGDCGVPNSALITVTVTNPPTPPPTPKPTPKPTPTPTPIPTATPAPPPTSAATPTPAPAPATAPTPMSGPTPRTPPAPGAALRLSQVPVPSPSPTPTPAPAPATSATAPPVASITTPPPAPRASPPPTTPLSYDPGSHATAVVNLQVAAFALLTFAGTGGVAAAGMVLRPAAAEEHRKQGRAATTKVKQAGWGGRAAAGDRSPTWRWPATGLVDGLSVTLPVRLASRSPLLARLLADGAHLRAMLGSAALVLPVAGAILGAMALGDTGGHALPPHLALLAPVCVLGVLDAMSGVLATLVFVAGVAVLGGLSTAGDVRVMLGLAALWCAVPVIANAARPLRRQPSAAAGDRFDRGADFVVASLIGAWAVQRIAAGFPGLTGHPVAIASQANTLALVVLGAMVGRMLLEEITAHLYPQRLASVLPAKAPSTGLYQRLAASAVRTAVLLVIAVAFVGSRWQLYAGAALFLVSQLAIAYEHSFGNFPRLYPMVPRGICKATLLLLVGRWMSMLIGQQTHDPRQLIADAFLLLTIAMLPIALVDLVGRDAPDPGWRWRDRLAGAAVLALGLLFALGVLS